MTVAGGLVSFEEEQRVAPWVAQGVFWFFAVMATIIYFVEGRDQEVVIELAFFLAPVLVILGIVFVTLKMTTRVTGEGVHIKTLYFISRLVPFSEIESAEAIRYRPILDYGGWGYRISRKGKAYNLRGDRGVQLALKKGGRVLIGSQREDELAAAIKSGLR